MPKGGAAEKARLELALKNATDDARRLYVSHEKERKVMETADKAATDLEQFERIRERERLRGESQQYVEIESDLRYLRNIVLDEARKHERWAQVTSCNWLPEVDDEAQITAFLNTWREEQERGMGMMNEESTMHMRYSTVAGARPDDTVVHMDNLIVQRLDTAPSHAYRRRRLDDDLRMCVLSVQLAENIWRAADLALMRNDLKSAARHKAHLKLVYDTILLLLDRMTCVVGLNVDVFADPEDDFLLRTAPPSKESSTPYIKYGLWLRTNEKRLNTNANVIFQALGIFIEPKDSASVKLPRALGLMQNHSVTIRAMQLSFDPCSVNCNAEVCQEFIALDCVLVLESITLPERSKRVGDWTCRVESTNPPVVHRNDYPPKQTGTYTQLDELTMKVTFELPKTVAIRQSNLMIGKWNQQLKRWEHTSTATMTQESIRRFAFLTNDLTTLAVIQEKGFDVPYESWRINPVTDDEVMFYVQGRHRDDHHNERREVQILIRGDMCKLLGPEDAELNHLRGSWMPPPTLLRLLARAGYNFILTDKDGDALPHVLTKTRELEEKGYADIALFASRFAIASSRHNKAGEDRDMALFRMSRAIRSDDYDAGFEPNPADESKWHSMRYETGRCVLAQFREADDDALLSAVQGHETHLNMFMCLSAEFGEQQINSIAKESSPLLQQGVYKMLSLVRPFTWG
jgi:cancer susceptibility candidate protein 1